MQTVSLKFNGTSAEDQTCALLLNFRSATDEIDGDQTGHSIETSIAGSREKWHINDVLIKGLSQAQIIVGLARSCDFNHLPGYFAT